MHCTSKQMSQFSSLTGNSEIPEWANERVLGFKEIENSYFYCFIKPNKEIADVDLTKLIGTTHDGYIGLRWWEMRISLERNAVKTVGHAIDWMLKPLNDDDKAIFYKIGKHYLVGSGNHRACVAKLGGAKHAKAIVIELFFDYELFKLFNWCKERFELQVNDIEHTYIPQYVSYIGIWKIRSKYFTIEFRSREEIKCFQAVYENISINKVKVKMMFYLSRRLGIPVYFNSSIEETKSYSFMRTEDFNRTLKRKIMLAKYSLLLNHLC